MNWIRCALVGVAVTVSLGGCGEGDFDQRIRGEIDQLRAESFTGINSNPRDNPRTDPPPVTGDVTTGGFVTFGRVLLHPIDDLGVADVSEAAVLGNGVSVITQEVNSNRPPSSRFSATVRRPYEGAILVRVVPNSALTEVAQIAHPALGRTSPRVEFGAGEELWGYCPGFPSNGDAVVVSPLTTMAVARAMWLGGLSTGNLSLASRQVGLFFGVSHTRRTVGNNLTGASFSVAGAIHEDLVMAAISQLAAEAGVSPLAVLRGLVMDVRDDGDLNGSSGLIPGSGMLLPSLGQPGYVGARLIENGWLRAGNSENLSGYLAARDFSSVQEAIAFLDTARSLDDYPQELVDVTQAFTSVTLAPGGSTRLGLRGFTIVDSLLYAVAGSDGPGVWLRNATSSAPGVAGVGADGVIRVSALASAGQSAVISVRIRPDGTHLTGSFDRTFEIQVLVGAP